MKGLGIAKAMLFVCVWTVAFVPGLNAIICLADLVIFFLFYRGIVANANLLAVALRAPENQARTREQQSSPVAAAPLRSERLIRLSLLGGLAIAGHLVLPAPVLESA